MNEYYSGRSYSHRRRRSRLPRFLAVAACIALAGALGAGVFFLRKHHSGNAPDTTGSIVIPRLQTCCIRLICWPPATTTMLRSSC